LRERLKLFELLRRQRGSRGGRQRHFRLQLDGVGLHSRPVIASRRRVQTVESCSNFTIGTGGATAVSSLLCSLPELSLDYRSTKPVRNSSIKEQLQRVLQCVPAAESVCCVSAAKRTVANCGLSCTVINAYSLTKSHGFEKFLADVQSGKPDLFFCY
jgi:hypothetical protein